MKQNIFNEQGGKVGLKYYGDIKAFIKCSSAMQNVYKTIDKYNPGKY